MILEKLSLINYKNIAAADLELSTKMNCFIGHNGAGKTNVLDAVYFLSFCRSATNPIDSQVLRHGEDFMMLEGFYSPLTAHISCGMKRGQKKVFKRDKKAYKRLSEHIGLIPLVMIAPDDTLLIDGGSEERRRLLDMGVSQLDRSYIEALNNYNKTLQQRNTLLKDEEHEPDPDVMSILEEQMAHWGEAIYARRSQYVEQSTPRFQAFYNDIANAHEEVTLRYTSHCQRGPLLEVIRRDRMKDRAVGYSLHGVHRDDLEILLDGHPMRREGSQGQRKTFAIALKLAQYKYLSQYTMLHTPQATGSKPLLLLDDIFDKLDSQRVEKIVALVSGDEFGQIFITDTNRDHLDQILKQSSHDYKLFNVNNGEICLSATFNQ